MRREQGTRAGADALDALFWRSEILQALYWLQGEGLASDSTPTALASFLVADPEVVGQQVVRLVGEGFLEPAADPARIRLTALGLREGGRSFKDEFEGLTRPAHYECGPGCWCKDPDHFGEPCPNHQPAPAPAPDPEGPGEARRAR